jgi:serine phosphatase RsbU (regulator of sigma subunit)
MPIGGEQKEAERCFTAHEISLQNPTTFYLFSDGYQDQFGGNDRKKFGITNLKKLLFEIHSYPMPEQQQLLEHSITTWMQDGRETQIDDILIMGIRVG